MNELHIRVWSGRMWFDGNDALRVLMVKNPDETDITLTYTFPHENYRIIRATGLKDKNGVEIYEGDIYEVIGFSGIAQLDHYQVMYINGAFVGGTSTESFGPLAWDTQEDSDELIENWPSGYSSVRVIGNIYENPELLTNAA